MVDVENLRVSLTKNGYLKVAVLVEHHPSHEILDHVSGSHAGVHLVRSQVANILCADPLTGMVPGFWDDVRAQDAETIRAFTFIAIVFSHVELIRAFVDAGRGDSTGVLFRNEIGEKQYTNLQYAMSEVGLCRYARGTDQVSYDMTPLTRRLRPIGDSVGELFRAKLRRCGWRDPEAFRVSPDQPLVQQCCTQRFNDVFGLSARQFGNWISGRPSRPR